LIRSPGLRGSVFVSKIRVGRGRVESLESVWSSIRDETVENHFGSTITWISGRKDK